MQDTGLSELWNLSAEALAEVEAIRSRYSVHRTIWYFEPIRDEDDDDLDMSGPFWSEVQRQVAARFPTSVNDVIGIHCGVEIMDERAPTSDWLKTRMAEMKAFADATGLFLRGWTYEPVGFSVGAPPQAFAHRLPKKVQ
jgi:hypothetical protein